METVVSANCQHTSFSKKSVVLNNLCIIASECTNCKQVFLNENSVLAMKKLREKNYSATVGVLGNSLIIRIPKDYSDVYQLTKGSEVELEASTSSGFMIKLRTGE